MEVKRSHRAATGAGMFSNELGEDPLRAQIRQRALNARMAVSMGHQTPTTNIPSYMSDFEVQQVRNAAKRVAMPAHMTAPPPLVGYGSTGSSFGEWEANTTVQGTKRPLEAPEPLKSARECDVDELLRRHGPLSFNEDF